MGKMIRTVSSPRAAFAAKIQKTVAGVERSGVLPALLQMEEARRLALGSTVEPPRVVPLTTRNLQQHEARIEDEPSRLEPFPANLVQWGALTARNLRLHEACIDSRSHPGLPSPGAKDNASPETITSQEKSGINDQTFCDLTLARS